VRCHKNDLRLPAQANTAGFRNIVLDASFNDLSRVDVADTGGSNFDMWVRTLWPAVSTPSTDGLNYWAQITSPASGTYSSVTDAGSQNTKVLQQTGGINAIPPASGGSDIVLASAIYDSGSSGYIGKVFNGGYFECRMAAEIDTTSNAAYAFWMLPLEFLNSVVGGSNSVNNVEVDIMETGDTNSAHATTITWFPYNTNTNQGAQNDLTLTMSNGVFHTFGCLWKTKAQNGGVGSLEFYVDNVLQPSCTQTYTSGALAAMDTHHYVLFVSAIAGHFVHVDWVRAWQ